MTLAELEMFINNMIDTSMSYKDTNEYITEYVQKYDIAKANRDSHQSKYNEAKNNYDAASATRTNNQSSLDYWSNLYSQTSVEFYVHRSTSYGWCDTCTEYQRKCDEYSRYVSQFQKIHDDCTKTMNETTSIMTEESKLITKYQNEMDIWQGKINTLGSNIIYNQNDKVSGFENCLDKNYTLQGITTQINYWTNYCNEEKHLVDVVHHDAHYEWVNTGITTNPTTGTPIDPWIQIPIPAYDEEIYHYTDQNDYDMRDDWIYKRECYIELKNKIYRMASSIFGNEQYGRKIETIKTILKELHDNAVKKAQEIEKLFAMKI